MSTEFKGDYCATKDKMMLTQQEAVGMMHRLRHMHAYRCTECGAWHLASNRGQEMKKTTRSRWRNGRR